MQQQQHPHVQQPQPPQQFVQATQQPTPVHAETDPGAGLATGSAKRRVYPSQQLPLQQTMHAQQPQLQTQQQQPQQQQPALLAPNPAIAQLQSLTNERAGEPDRNLSESQTSLFSSMNGINEFSSRFANVNLVLVLVVTAWTIAHLIPAVYCYSLQNTPVAQGGVPPAVPLIGHRPPVEELSWPSVPPATSAQFMCTPESGVLCPASYKRCTINAIPQTPSLLSKSRIPFGMILHPFKAVDDGEVVPVLGATSRADPGHPVYEASTIVRCRRCRTYINPFVQFTDTAHWRCNICFLVNDLPANFLYNPQTQQKVFRPEISHGIVEYIAPADYMVRPPQPPVFVFVVDVSVNAVNSGMLETFAKVLANSLDSIPNADLRARIAFITFDSAIHFYHLTVCHGRKMLATQLSLIFFSFFRTTRPN